LEIQEPTRRQPGRLLVQTGERRASSGRLTWSDRKTDMLAMHGIDVDDVVAAATSLLSRAQAA
jgi:hypothetical protein